MPTPKQLLVISWPLLFTAFAWWKTRKFSSPVNLIFGWGVLSIMAGLGRFDLKHFQPAIPFFALLMAMWVVRLRRPAAIVLAALSLLWVGNFYRHQSKFFLQTRFFDPPTAAVAAAIKERSQPGDTIFLLGAQPLLYPLTQTLPPGRFFVFHLPWLLRVTQTRQLYSLVVSPPRLVIWDTASRVDRQPLSSYAPDLLKYIQRAYQLTGQIGTYAIYENRP